MALLQILFLASILLSVSHATEARAHPFLSHLLTRLPDHSNSIYCKSWRLAVETNNIIEWTEIPDECIEYVGNYMLGKQYKSDIQVVVNQASDFANSVNISSDGKDIWVFDIDETVLSNLPLYVEYNFGPEANTETAFTEWIMKGKAPALEDTLGLYEELLSLGSKIVFLTGRGESSRNATATNLKNVGYHTWEKLILKGSAYSGKTALYYKSKERGELEKKGYRIIGNMGDQWSDLMGSSNGNRTFKVPDPLYYLS